MKPTHRNRAVAAARITALHIAGVTKLYCLVDKAKISTRCCILGMPIGKVVSLAMYGTVQNP